MMSEQAWIIVGFIGQALFGTRFLIQWLTSERAKRSVIPTTFWYFSVGGSLVLLCYSLHKPEAHETAAELLAHVACGVDRGRSQPHRARARTCTFDRYGEQIVLMLKRDLKVLPENLEQEVLAGMPGDADEATVVARLREDALMPVIP